MGERAFFVRLNIDDMADSLDGLETTEERGLWLEGFRFGVRGKEQRDGWPEVKQLGYAFGLECWTKAQEFRDKQAEKGRASGNSRRKPTAVEPDTNHGSTAVQPEFNRTGTEREPIQNPEANNQELLPKEPIPPTPQRGNRAARATAPTEEEWVAYCTSTWPDWHPTCAAESWAYYQAKGWRIGSVPVRDWQAAARTSHGNARQWGKLQPEPTNGHAFSGRPGPATARRPTDQALIDQLRNQGQTDATNHGHSATTTSAPALSGSSREILQRAIERTASGH